MTDEPIQRAKLTLERGTFEFEGSREFVERQVEIVLAVEQSERPPEPRPVRPASSVEVSPTKGRRLPAEHPRMLTQLVDTPDRLEGLKRFYEAKAPRNHIQTFAVLTAWLQESLGMEAVSVDEMWTLYRVLGLKPPRALVQTFRDGKSKKALFESSGVAGNYFLTPVGQSYVTFDLPESS